MNTNEHEFRRTRRAAIAHALTTRSANQLGEFRANFEVGGFSVNATGEASRLSPYSLYDTNAAAFDKFRAVRLGQTMSRDLRYMPQGGARGKCGEDGDGEGAKRTDDSIAYYFVRINLRG